VFDFEGSSWWNSSYQYKQKLTITEMSGNDLINYQVNYSFDHRALVVAGKSNADGSDIRIINESGDEIPRCLHPWSSWNSASDDTMIWFNVTLAASSSVDYYMYYGNPAASDPGYSGDDVFLLYDNFTGIYLSGKWVIYCKGNSNVTQNDILMLNNKETFKKGAHVYTADDFTRADGIRILVEWRPHKRHDASSMPFFEVPIPNIKIHHIDSLLLARHSDYGEVRRRFVGVMLGNHTNDVTDRSALMVYDNGGSYSSIHGRLRGSSPINIDENQWHTLEITINNADQNVKVYLDDTQRIDSYYDPANWSSIGNTYKVELSSSEWTVQGSPPLINTERFDDFCLAKFITGEPTITPGGEEQDYVPEISNPSPPDGSSCLPNPQLSIQIYDGNDDPLNVTWYWDDSGTWKIFGKNTTINGGPITLYQTNGNNFSSRPETYYWNVSVTDGSHTNNSPIYHFTTGPPWVVKLDTMSSDATAYNNGRKLVRTSNGNLHCVYHNFNGGSTYTISYANSVDNGETWTETPLVTDELQKFPAIAVDSNEHLHVVWHGWDTSTETYELRYMNLTSGTIVDLTNGSYLIECNPSIAIDSNDNLHVVWWSGNTSCGYNINYRNYSHTSGWSSIRNLSGGGSNLYPSIAVDNDDSIHVVWHASSSKQIHYNKHVSSGWTGETALTSGSYEQRYASIAIDRNNHVHVVWQGKTSGSGIDRIRYLNLSNWGIIENLTSEDYSQGHPSIVANTNGNLHVVWHGTSSSNPTYTQIQHLKHSANPGWETIEELTNVPADQTYPSLLWAMHPTVSGKPICGTKTGYGFIYLDDTTVKYYHSADLVAWNNAPQINSTYPGNGTDLIPVMPMLNVTVYDPDGDLMDITWLYYHWCADNWFIFDTNNSVSGGNHSQNCSYFSSYLMPYRWAVIVDDGIDAIWEDYWFITEPLQAGDDCQEDNNGEIYLGNSTIRIGNNNTLFHIAGFHFPNASIPPNYIVANASLMLYFDGSSGEAGPWNVSIRGINASCTDTWSSSNKPSQGTKTDAQVYWQIDDLSSMPTGYNSSPNIKTIIQEIINRGDWSLGNNLSLVIENNNGGYVDVRAVDYPSPLCWGAILNISYAVDLSPTPCFGYRDLDGGAMNTELEFNASCSSDDLGIVRIEWDWDYAEQSPFEAMEWFEGSNLTNGYIVTHDYGDIDTHLVALRVNDSLAATDPYHSNMTYMVVHADRLEKTPVRYKENNVTVESGDTGWSQTGNDVTISCGVGNDLQDTVCIVLYDDTIFTDPDNPWNLTACYIIWLFDSNSLRYELPSRDGTYHITLENGGVLTQKPGQDTYVADGPQIYEDVYTDGNQSFVFRMNQLRTSSFGSGSGKLRLKKNIGLNCARDKDLAHNLKFQFFGDHNETWIKYFNGTYNFIREDFNVTHPGDDVWFKLAHATVFFDT
jgi:hypothetical protein